MLYACLFLKKQQHECIVFNIVLIFWFVILARLVPMDSVIELFISILHQKGEEFCHKSNSAIKLVQLPGTMSRDVTEKGPVSGFVGRIPLPTLESRITRNH